MNTARSVWVGWATLMVAGAGAYYFAKKDIDAHRREQELKGLRGTEFLDWQQIVDRGEAAKAAAEQSRSTQDDKSGKPGSKKRSHDDKLG